MGSGTESDSKSMYDAFLGTLRTEGIELLECYQIPSYFPDENVKLDHREGRFNIKLGKRPAYIGNFKTPIRIKTTPDDVKKLVSLGETDRIYKENGSSITYQRTTDNAIERISIWFY